MLKTLTIDLVRQPYLDVPPVTPDDLHKRAIAADDNTMNHWRDTWLKNYRTSKEKFGTWGDYSFGQLFGKNRHKPAICIGSGPSLKDSLEDLRKNQEAENPVLTISCLHNFGYFKDNGIKADYWMSLDAGKIVMADISEGREKGDYWDETKGENLIAYVGSDIELFEKWQGNVFLFNTTMPDPKVMEEVEKIEKFRHFISCGGNALGACMYTAKAVMGSSKIIYVGADFCFDYDNTFHSYKTHYDVLGGYILHPDIYGIPRKTWMSYLGFKSWLDKCAMTIPGEWVNASGGLLGAYLGGNLRHYSYCDLGTALVPYKIADSVEKIAMNGEKSRLDLSELFKNPQFEDFIVLF